MSTPYILVLYYSRHGATAEMARQIAGERFPEDIYSRGLKVYTTLIPRNVRVSEAPSYGKPVLLYDFKSTGSQAYLRLAAEIIQRERRLRAA